MTFFEGDMDKGRVVTWSSNFSQLGIVTSEFRIQCRAEKTGNGDYEICVGKI